MTAGARGKVRVLDVERGEVQIRAETLNEGDRTVEIIWAAGAAVQRYDWYEGEYFLEELSMDPASIRMERFQAGMSFVDSHSTSRMADRLGVVVPGSVRIVGGRGLATIRFSRKPEAEALFQDVRDGMPFPVSVGYKIHAYERTDASETSIARLTATDWEPFELSAVPVPADVGAHSRTDQPSPDLQLRAVPVGGQTEGFPMSQTTETRGQPQPAPDRQPSMPSADVLAERTRAENIRTIGRRTGITADVIDAAVAGGMSAEAFRERAFDAMVERQRDNNFFPYSATGGIGSMDQTRAIESQGEALYGRADPTHQLTEGARQFAGRSVLDVARDCLERSGVSVRSLAPDQCFARALHSSSDFSAILGAAVSHGVRAGYASPDSNLRLTGRRVTLQNFKQHFSVSMGAAPRLLKVNEHGEFKRGTMRESAESYGLMTFGRIIGLTRQLLLNDDLGFFGRIPAQQGRAARELELQLLVDAIESTAPMADGRPVFAAEHGNLATTPAALSVSALKAARLSFRKQTGLDGEIIGIAPKFLVVPSELETEAEIVLSEITAASVSDVNPFSGRLTLIVEPRLRDPKAWFLVADPAQVDGLEFGLLEGHEEPFTEERVGFDVDGIEFKVRHDFGCGFVDHRGWYKNAGA